MAPPFEGLSQEEKTKNLEIVTDLKNFYGRYAYGYNDTIALAAVNNVVYGENASFVSDDAQKSYLQAVQSLKTLVQKHLGDTRLDIRLYYQAREQKQNEERERYLAVNNLSSK